MNVVIKPSLPVNLRIILSELFAILSYLCLITPGESLTDYITETLDPARTMKSLLHPLAPTGERKCFEKLRLPKPGESSWCWLSDGCQDTSSSTRQVLQSTEERMQTTSLRPPLSLSLRITGSSFNQTLLSSPPLLFWSIPSPPWVSLNPKYSCVLRLNMESYRIWNCSFLLLGALLHRKLSLGAHHLLAAHWCVHATLPRQRMELVERCLMHSGSFLRSIARSHLPPHHRYPCLSPSFLEDAFLPRSRSNRGD